MRLTNTSGCRGCDVSPDTAKDFLCDSKNSRSTERLRLLPYTEKVYNYTIFPEVVSFISENFGWSRNEVERIWTQQISMDPKGLQFWGYLCAAANAIDEPSQLKINNQSGLSNIHVNH